MSEHAFILAGGSGTRLWPASRRDRPKQFLKLGEYSLLQETVRRVFTCGNIRRAFVICGERQLEGIIDELAVLQEYQDRISLLPEPEGRNTAPAVALGLKYLVSADKTDSTVIITPSDHLITPDGAYRQDIKRADTMADGGYLVTFGVVPDRPETGFGYIKAGPVRGPGRLIDSFREKPDHNTAKQYIAEGGYYWNTGMFIAGAGHLIEEFGNYFPPLHEFITGPGSFRTEETENLQIIRPDRAIGSAYGTMTGISFDRAVMEKTESAAVIPASFNWNDIGSWDEFAAASGRNDTAVSVSSRNNAVFSDIPVALCGVEDLIVVISGGAALICGKGKSQDVRNLVEKLSDSGMGEFL
ncbi:MAG: mannose-1-phosphate guanylyltransferase [Spirochaetia bacterium]